MPLGVNSVRRETVQLGEGEVWVESDAGFGYKDSNLFGPVRAETIQVAAVRHPELLVNIACRGKWSTQGRSTPTGCFPTPGG